MGNCVQRDCGFDVYQKNQGRAVETLKEENVRHKTLFQRKLRIDPKSERIESSSDDSEEEDKQKEEDFIHGELILDNTRSKNMTSAIDAKNQDEEHLIKHNNAAHINNKAYTGDFDYSSVDDLKQVEKELYEFVIASTPNLRDDQTRQTGSTKISKFVQPSYHTYDTMDSLGTGKQESLSIPKSTYDGAENSDYPHLQNYFAPKINQTSKLLPKSTGSYQGGSRGLNTQGSKTLTANKYPTLKEGRGVFDNRQQVQADGAKITITKEAIVTSKTNRGRITGFENVYFRDLVTRSAKTISVSPDMPKILVDEDSDDND